MSNEMMKAVVITGPGMAVLQDVERIPVEAGEVLVRCKAAAICTAERRVFSGDLRYYPLIGGHELAGVVEWTDYEDSGLKAGDHVAIDAHNRCGRCYYCVKGRNNMCEKMFEFRKDYKYLLMGGGFAEYTALLPGQVVKLPDHLDLEEASMLEPLACCIHSIKKAHLSFGDVLAIIGAGTMGMLHLMLAKIMGAKVIVSDIDEARLSMANKLGADLTVNPAQGDPVHLIKDYTVGRGADAVVVAASTRQAGEQGLKLVGRTGRVVFFASLHPPGAI